MQLPPAREIAAHPVKTPHGPPRGLYDGGAAGGPPPPGFFAIVKPGYNGWPYPDREEPGLPRGIPERRGNKKCNINEVVKVNPALSSTPRSLALARGATPGRAPRLCTALLMQPTLPARPAFFYGFPFDAAARPLYIPFGSSFSFNFAGREGGLREVARLANVVRKWRALVVMARGLRE